MFPNTTEPARWSRREFSWRAAGRCQTLPARRHAGSLYMGSDELDDLVHRGSGLEDCRYTGFFEAIDVLIGNDSANEDNDVIHLVLAAGDP